MFCNRWLVFCAGALSSVAAASLAAAVMYWYNSWNCRHRDRPVHYISSDADALLCQLTVMM